MKPFYVTTPIYYVNDLPHIGHIYSTVVTDAVTRYHRLIGRPDALPDGNRRARAEHREGGRDAGHRADRAGRPGRLAVPRPVPDVRDLERRFHPHDGAAAPRRRRSPDRADRGRRGTSTSPSTKAGTARAARRSTPRRSSTPRSDVLSTARRRPGSPRRTSSSASRSTRRRSWRTTRRHPEFVRPESRLAEVVSFVKGGLNDLSVSRSKVKWGSRFPGIPATSSTSGSTRSPTTSRRSASARATTRLYREFWEHPEAERVHIIGKDILRFHAVFWPAFLLSAGLPLPTTVWAHGWWLRDAKKISKSVGNVVRPDAPRRGLRARRAALLPAARDGLRPGRELLGRGVPDALQRGSRQRPRQHGLARRGALPAVLWRHAERGLRRQRHPPRVRRGGGRVARGHARVPVQPRARGRLEAPDGDQRLRRRRASPGRSARKRAPTPRASTGSSGRLPRASACRRSRCRPSSRRRAGRSSRPSPCPPRTRRRRTWRGESCPCRLRCRRRPRSFRAWTPPPTSRRRMPP